MAQEAPSLYEGALLARAWRMRPNPVFGGYAIVLARWVRDPFTGWDEETEPVACEREVYPTSADAIIRIEQIRRGACEPCKTSQRT